MNNNLSKVISTLNNIEVHGKNNLDMLLGCIMALEQIESQMEQDVKGKTKEETSDG
jgi:hypothetical protein